MATVRMRIFISSVQKEFKQIRLDLKAFLLGDAFLHRFVSEVFLFEEIPAKDRRADEVYLEEVERCDIYLGLFGYEYGHEDRDGISPTENEYNFATEKRKPRFVYVWGTDENKRSPKMKKLIAKASEELIRRRVMDTSALTAEIYASLVDYLDNTGALRVPPFDTAGCEGTELKDISRKRILWFLETARRERGFPLKPNTATKAFLTHLNLLDGAIPTNAAVLLFGTDPQGRHPNATTKCVHCHGTEYRRPFASLQEYRGDIFDQADQAGDFVLSKINRSVGTRSMSITAPATYELPPDAVAEAIVNAIAHRDYHSNASVEVRLFVDRLEVWNPGRLPGTLKMEDLRTDHPSVPFNPLLAESLYLSRYIERVGSGTQAIIALCREAGLPEPQFEQRSGFFVITLWRDWLTEEAMRGLDLSDRQMKAVVHIKTHGRITSSEYQQLTDVSRQTATRDLDELVRKAVASRYGAKRGSYYVLKGRMPQK